MSDGSDARGIAVGAEAASSSSGLPDAADSTASAVGRSSPPGRAQSLSAVYRRRSTFSFPRAAQPEVVRAYQKDAYYREQLQAQLHDVVRSLLGSRVLFQHAELVSFVGSVAYFTLSTLGGAQTLGEEYVNAMMTDGRSGRIVGLKRRMAFIILHIVAPFLLARSYSAARRRLIAEQQTRSQALQRARLRAQALAPRRAATQGGASLAANEPQPSMTDRSVGFLATHMPSLDAITSGSGAFAYLGAAHLALFYLGGRYYKFSQRFSRTEYISSIARRPGQQPPSYEVLGFLLGVQLMVKILMQANRWRTTWMARRNEERRAAEANEKGGEGVSSDADGASAADASPQDSVEIDGTLWSHKTSPPTRVLPGGRGRGPQQQPTDRIVPLAYVDPDALPSAADLGLPRDVDRAQLEAGRSASKVRAAELESIAQGVLRCTLCMEQREPQRGTSAVTECGHVFCWDCIYGWTREKPECPLCRQSLNPSHLLPIYNF